MNVSTLSPLELMFYLSGLLAIFSSLKVVTRKNTVHALLYLVVSLLAVAVCFYLMGAPFAAALEVIVYAGAILILFVFAIVMFGLVQDETLNSRHFPKTKQAAIALWFGPSVLAALLFAVLVFSINNADIHLTLTVKVISAKKVGVLLYGPYLLAVEIASFLLLAGLVSAYHLANNEGSSAHSYQQGCQPNSQFNNLQERQQSDQQGSEE